MSINNPQEKTYNAGEFLKFVEAERNKPGNENAVYELINGRIYKKSAPNMNHMGLAKFIYDVFAAYLSDRPCDAYFAPCDIFLVSGFIRTKNKKVNKNKCKDVVQPDLFILCDKDKIKQDGIHGAPDLVLEVVSKSSTFLDYTDKLDAYAHLGVREYWIIDPLKMKIIIYEITNDGPDLFVYKFNEVVESKIFPTMTVDFSKYVWIKD